MAPPAHILLVTVNGHERNALRDAFQQVTGETAEAVPGPDRVYHHLGSLHNVTFFHALSQMGGERRGGMRDTVDKAIRFLQPGAVIAVGIAYGVDDAKQRIGDILISSQIHCSDPQRVGRRRVTPRGDIVGASPQVLNFFQEFAQAGWNDRPVKQGLILSSEKLIDNKAFRNGLLKLFPEAIGGEMEGAGLYYACAEHNVQWIVIKAICDWADGNKRENKSESQQLAANNAAQFLAYSLQKTPLLIERGGKRDGPAPSETPSNGQLAPVVADESHVGHTSRPKGGQPYIVGRGKEVDLLKGMMEATKSRSILNIYGPAGIGKTTLCEKLSGWCKSQQIPSATVDLYSLFNVTVRAIACKLRDMLVSSDNLHVARWSFEEVQHAFREFNHLVEEHDQITSAIIQHGDVTGLFNKFGFLKTPYRRPLTHPVFVRREALERYLREVDGTLAESFVHGVTSLAYSRRLVLFVDTWEKLDHNPSVEEWLSTKLLPNLPSGATAVLFGRSQAQKFANRLGVSSHLLEALSESDTKAYLRHHGLQDHKTLDAVYEVTKGYPLCLALACDLSRKARGWDAVSKISVASEAIAEELLKRLLEEEGVEDVRDFLEKGIVAEWFDRGSIRYILGVSEARAKKIYQRIRGYSFVRPHPYGLQFHEGIRDILRRRLEVQNKKEYARLTKKWADYFRKSQKGHL